MESAAGSGADALILDLEDSVPPAEKPNARENVREFLEASPGIPVYVRIESIETTFYEEDLNAVVRPGLTGLVLSKLENDAYLIDVDRRVATLAHEHGLDAASVVLLPMIESALGIRRIYETLASQPRAAGVGFSGAEDGDLYRDLGATWTPAGTELLYARSKTVLDARAAGAELIIDGVFARIDDDAAFLADTRQGHRLGFTGRFAIHPRQVGIINDVYTPGPEQIAYYQCLLDEYRRAGEAGQAAIRYEGRLVDKAMAAQAQRVLDLAARLRTPDAENR
jgi:citrate lyase subunit beta/citryl-CoA lyase